MVDVGVRQSPRIVWETFLGESQMRNRGSCRFPSMMAVLFLRRLVEVRVPTLRHRDGVSMRAEFDVDGGAIDDVWLLITYIRRGI